MATNSHAGTAADPESMDQAPPTRCIPETKLARTLLAKDAEISRAAIEAWLSGNRNPTSQSAEQLAAGLERRATRLQYLAFRLRTGLSE